MYEIDSKYSAYYNEIDPKKRLIILDSLPEDGADTFVREVYNDRYSDHEGKGRKNIDWWLWRCICREISTIIAELRMNDSDEVHRQHLYHEYRNTCRRYLSTCRSGSYAARFMGFRQASDEEKVLKACEDVWQMSAGVAKKTGNTEAMKLWIEAFRDELYDYDDICREEYMKLQEE